MKRQILLIDSDRATHGVLRDVLSGSDSVLSVESDPSRGLARMRSQEFDTLFVSLEVQSDQGKYLLTQARESSPSVPLVVITSQATLDTSLRAFRQGAADFLAKPLCAADIHAALLRSEAWRKAWPPAMNSESLRICELREPLAEPIHESPAMQQVIERARSIAVADVAISASGESGAGKETLLRWMHAESARRFRPFVRVFCNSIQENYIDEMLFGSVPDSAKQNGRQGFVEQAAGGTLLLHDADSLPHRVQYALADAIISRTFHKANDKKPIAFAARLMVTTREPLSNRHSGAIVNELRVLLETTPLYVPPLRERIEDIRPLVKVLCQETGRDASLRSRWGNLSFSDAALGMLEGHAWPGNIDELRNFVRRLFVFARHPEIVASHVTEFLPTIPIRIEDRHLSLPVAGNLKAINRAIVSDAIQRARGNKSAAARSLGLHRKTLYRIIAEDARSNGQRRRN